MITVNDVAATKWKQLIFLHRPTYRARFFQAADFPYLFRAVKWHDDGRVETKWACDDEVCVTVGDVVARMNGLAFSRATSQDERLALALEIYQPVDVMEYDRVLNRPFTVGDDKEARDD